MKRLYRFFFHLGIWMLMALSGIGFLCAENPGCTNLTGFNLPPDLCALSNKQFNAIAGSTSTSLNFSWTSADSLANLVSDLGFLRIAAWDGNNWVNIGQSAVSGNLTAGFITTNPVVPNNYFLYKFAAAKPEVFGVTGGGAYCALTDAGVPIGLNGSQIGVNYQLKINNNDVGLPVSGTGNAISFGNQKTLGSYSVVASMGSAACMVYMNGLATVNSIVCEANISDPCSCKNNATTLSNGQFDETVQVNAPANQSWTVTAVNGFYLGNSPAPPASPIAIPLGTPLTYIGSNTYQIKGIHVDAIGYSITVSNGQGTSLSIGNTCAYPNPSFIPNLDVPFCLYSNPITLSGNPGDNNILSQNFTINGVSSAIFNPGAGLGAYTLIYTVNGGSPKAFGPNDPGCIQSIEKVVNVVSTPSALFCNDQVNVSIDADCNTQVLPDDVLEGSYGCLDDYLVELDRNAPFGNGPWTNSTLTSADIGKTYQARVTHLGSGNYCYGLITVEDKLPPVLTCSDITLFCPITNYDPNYLKNTLGINTAFPTVSDCSNYTLTYVDTWNDLSCGKGFNGVSDLSAYVVRKWTAKDAWNNSTSCIQYLYFKRLHISDVLFPADYTVSCSASNTSTDPLVTGAPYFLKFGLKWPLNPDPGFCEMQAIYNDQYLVDCEGSYSVVRTWTVIDWCLPTSPTPPDQNPITFIQQIKVVDNTGPNLVCPANLTVSVDDNSCCGTINLPDVVLTDNCSRINSVSAMVTTFDLYTNQQTGMYTVAGSVSDFPGNDLKLPDTLANYGYTPCLPLGTHTVVYVATDDCGNTKTCSFKMKVDDLIPPVPVCDQVTQVALNTNGQAVINATTFDDGSYDNCGTVYVKVGRLNSGSFSNTITFSCSDITPNPINIVLRVYDVNPGSGSVSSTTLEDHANDCMAKVQVVDKIKPVCTPPPNLTLTCELFDPTLTPYGKASVTDNCCLNNSKVYMGQKGLSHSLNYTLFDTVCNRGTLIRNFTAYDCYGQTSTCSQRLVVDYTQDYLIRFPNDVLITACDGTGNYGTPVFFGEDCELLGVSFEDQVFTVVPDACFKIERSWTIINWCTFNPNLGCINVPNPNPNPIENHPSNFPGPIVSPLGTAAPWAPTIVKINPGDAQATNYSSFYASNANCYKYKQIIKIADLQDPAVQCPTSPVEYCDVTPNDGQLWNESYWWDNVQSTHDLCEGEADLSITAQDACSGAQLDFRYLLFLDLDGDQTMETVVSSSNLPGANNVQYNNINTTNYTGGQPRAFDQRPVPNNQKYRFGLDWVSTGNSTTAKVRFDQIQSPILLPAQGNNVMQGVIPQLPYGTHKIKWYISDGCGNESTCEYTFVVKDCKKPTVVCINGLSVNIMPTSMVTLWASDFLQYTEDNCTPVDQLKIAVRKSADLTPGFPVDAAGNPLASVIFTCADLGTQQVKLWSIDKAGNADYCETYVIVQDNASNCLPSSITKVAGDLITENISGVDNASVNIVGNGAGIPWFNFFCKTNQDGNYVFNAIPLSSNSTITPYKDDNPMNGVSTYDLVLISKHILGIQPLDSPYKMIAADANNSGSITSFDIIELRKLILGIYNNLPFNTSWRFVDKSYTFPNPANPFSSTFPEKRYIVNLGAGNNFNGDFVSIKVGDVNNSVISNAQEVAETRSTGTYLFDIENQVVVEGKTYEIHLKGAQAAEGCQFTLPLDQFELLELIPGAHMQAGHFGIHTNDLTVSYNGEEKAEFTMRVRAKKSGQLSDLIQVSSRITRAEAYPTSEQGGGVWDVALRFWDGKESQVRGQGFELYQNQPNPFTDRTQIRFFNPEPGMVNLQIMDQEGRVVLRQNGNFEKGFGQFAVVMPGIAIGNTYYYKVSTGTASLVKKMVYIR